MSLPKPGLVVIECLAIVLTGSLSGKASECRDMLPQAKTIIEDHHQHWRGLVASLQEKGFKPQNADDVLLYTTKLNPRILQDPSAKATLFYMYGVQEAFIEENSEKGVKAFSSIIDYSYTYDYNIALLYAAQKNYAAARLFANQGMKLFGSQGTIVLAPFLSQISGC